MFALLLAHCLCLSAQEQDQVPLPENGPVDVLYNMDGSPLREYAAEPVTETPAVAEEAVADSIAVSPEVPVSKGSMLDDLISGTSRDSLFYYPRSKKVYSHHESSIAYTDMNLTADFMEMDMETKMIYAHGMPDDSTGLSTRPIFTEKGTEYTMDTLNYNLDTGKGLIKGIYTVMGEGILSGGMIKRMPDNTYNVSHGRFSVCDHDPPHFYISMTRAKVLPDVKAVFGPSYLVMEGVPIPFLGLPFGFFPLSREKSSGFIMPSFGESAMKGFFLREGGYYFAPNDYIDLTLLGGIYTMGSWEASLSSRYAKRYKFRGNLNLNYNREVFGDRGSADFGNMTNFRVQWTHTQDPKASRGSTFSASVNFSTSGYNKYSSNNINDYVNSQTNSSIAYSKNWQGRPFSLSISANHSQNSRDSTISLTLPSLSFNVSRINPFKRRNALGREKWYEKIALTYSGTFSNSVTAKERDLFTEETFKSMRNGINHNIPITTSLSILKYINIEPRISYQERWYFSKVKKEWDENANVLATVDTTYGFYRLYNYSGGASASTRVYGTYEFKQGSAVRALRHVMTPTISFTYTPDFSSPRYGYYENVQVDSTGRMGYYSPYELGMYGVPGRNKSASLSFSLGNTLEAKVRSRTEKSGEKKIKILDALNFSGSYNLLADSLNLSTISVSLRSTIIPAWPITLNMVFDPYQVDANGRRINRFYIQDGMKLARLVSVNLPFSLTFNGGGATSDPNAINGENSPLTGDIYDPSIQGGRAMAEDPSLRRLRMTGLYYDFSIPYNASFNYNISYNNNGIKKTITQTLGFNGSLNLTPKWAITVSSGYDFQAKKITPGQFLLTRDLHCWQMSFSWVPTGFMQSWSFNISVKSGVLRDLKYDKRSGMYDNYYDK